MHGCVSGFFKVCPKTRTHISGGSGFRLTKTPAALISIFTQFCSSPLKNPSIFKPFKQSYVHRRPKKWISIGDRITGLFPYMYHGPYVHTFCKTLASCKRNNISWVKSSFVVFLFLPKKVLEEEITKNSTKAQLN